VLANLFSHSWAAILRLTGFSGETGASDDPMTTQYEVLYIIPATFTDEDVGNVEGNVKALLEKHGATIDSTTRLGKFRFAYPIKHVRHGHYVRMRITADTSSVAAIDAALRISNEVLRYLILRAEEAGGEKFDFVQFTEVSLDTRPDGHRSDDRMRRRTPESVRVPAEIASGSIATLEAANEPVASAPVPEISAEELEKKINAALEETP